MKKVYGWILAISALFVFALFALYPAPSIEPAADVAYSDFKTLVSEGKVSEVILRDAIVDGKLFEAAVLGGGDNPTHRFRSRIPAIGDPQLLQDLQATNVKIVALAGNETWLGQVSWLLPWLIFIAIYVWVWRRMSTGIGGFGGYSQLDRFLRPKRTLAVKETPKVTFGDVAGQENAKREVAELVDFLREPDRYRILGAEPPRGILLMGAPGTGKTLLARALAGEAGVPFFSISASEFIELFVGVGASRVRTLFDEAKKNAPAIVFIDELDSIGRVRGTGLGGGNDEREQTLNQILAELDGFGGHEAVIVLAATNRPDVLDPALLRPGRFDRHITLELPDKKARVDILKVHVRNVPLAKDVDLEVIAKGTPGFSGADLKNLVNEAAMMAAREGKADVAQAHFDAMRDRVLMGSERHLAIRPDERHRLAVHESGHALAAFHLAPADPLFKVSIVPRGRSLGGTQQLPDAERYIMDEGYLRARLAILLAGRAGESVALGSVSSGADDDIRQATALARTMVSRWGMAEKIGPMDVHISEEHPFLGREIALPQTISEATSHDVDLAIRDILERAEGRSLSLINAHRAQFDGLVAALEEEETLDRTAVEDILSERKRVGADIAAEAPGYTLYQPRSEAS